MSRGVQLLCAGLALSVLLIPRAGGQVPQGNLPVVESAAIPFYPPLARVGKVEGVVHLQLTTDGRKVIATHISDGAAWLAEAAERNVRTWQFRSHEPTSFTVTYIYKLVDDLKPQQSNPRVILQLPTDVEVDTLRWPGTNDMDHSTVPNGASLSHEATGHAPGTSVH